MRKKDNCIIQEQQVKDSSVRKQSFILTSQHSVNEISDLRLGNKLDKSLNWGYSVEEKLSTLHSIGVCECVQEREEEEKESTERSLYAPQKYTIQQYTIYRPEDIFPQKQSMQD